MSLKETHRPPGDATSEQMRVVADLADKYSFGEIRVSHEQNLILADVHEGDEIIISTNKGRVIRVAVKEIRTAGRNTQGVRIIKLSGEEKVVSAIKIDDNLI